MMELTNAFPAFDGKKIPILGVSLAILDTGSRPFAEFKYLPLFCDIKAFKLLRKPSITTMNLVSLTPRVKNLSLARVSHLR